MKWSVKYDSNLNRVECTAVGFLTMDDLIEATVKTASLAKEKGTNLIFVDDSQLENTIKITDIYNLPRLYDTLNVDRKNNHHSSDLIPTQIRCSILRSIMQKQWMEYSCIPTTSRSYKLAYRRHNW